MRYLLIACFCLFAQALKAAELRALEELGPTNQRSNVKVTLWEAL